MEKEITEVYCGNGRGKTTLAIGQALRASSQGKSVIIIQFLKGNERRELDFLEELDLLIFWSSWMIWISRSSASKRWRPVTTS